MTVTQLELQPVEHHATDRAIATAAENAPTGWNADARQVVSMLARRQPTLIADDVWLSGLAKPPEARALGNVMRWAVKTGLIVATDQFVPSQQSGGHQRPSRVWRSLVYEGDE